MTGIVTALCIMSLSLQRVELLKPAGLTKKRSFTTILNKGIQANISFDELQKAECEFDVVRGFIKKKCMVNNETLFKCPFSQDFYAADVIKRRSQTFSHLCTNDPSFYQSCGHMIFSPPPQQMQGGVGVCGEILCYEEYEYIITGFIIKIARVRNLLYNYYEELLCDGVDHCTNLIDGIPADEAKCGQFLRTFKCGPCPLDIRVPEISEKLVCDNICDCENCFDEARCFNKSVGIICKKNMEFHTWDRECSNSHISYVKPLKICDNIRHCKGGIDEIGCSTKDTCKTTSYLSLINPKIGRRLHPRSKCSVPEWKKRQFLLCDDYRDQMNCTDSPISPLICNINGYPTNLSEHVICKDRELCDDNIDGDCVKFSKQCKIHKHQICDGIGQCSAGIDEGDHLCSSMTTLDISCVRKLSYDRLPSTIPTKWVLDGVTDCMSGIDEDVRYWYKKCGTGNIDEYKFSEKSFNCEKLTLLKCPGTETGLKISDVCKNFKNCDKSTCMASRQSNKIDYHFEQLTSQAGLFFCLPGLKHLQQLIGPCNHITMEKGHNIYGVDDKMIALSPNYAASVDCHDIFGEIYVFLTCTNYCKQDIKCPLAPINYLSCTNNQKPRILTITDDYQLTVAFKAGVGKFTQDVFNCGNNRCVEYHKVCDLIDDCGDESDESSCQNNFHCDISGEYIPRSKVCDGFFNCFDYSDECNNQCDNQVNILSNKYIHVIAYTFGAAATILNVWVIIEGLKGYSNIKTGKGRLNESLILVISSGDLLQGIFLLLVIISDRILNKSTCKTQFKWVTGNMCTFLGVISTVGSQVSIYAMTILSIIRAKGTRSFARPSEDMTKKDKVVQIGGVVGTYFVAVLVALIPIFDYFEEYFVREFTYNDNPIFIGSLDKADHMRIIEAYYGRLPRITLFWGSIKKTVNDMFINSPEIGQKIGFYGSNGFCLFKYFVRDNNPQFWFIGAILGGNMACVATITLCYIIVNAAAAKSKVLVGGNNKEQQNRTRRIQRKIGIMIATDILTWVPFMFVCFIHFLRVIDTSGWYSIFSIIFLPINSVINPCLILEKAITKNKLFDNWNRMKAAVHQEKINDLPQIEMTRRFRIKQQEESSLNGVESAVESTVVE